MASQSIKLDIDSVDDLPRIVDDLNNALDRLDRLGLTVAGAQLATVLDTLEPFVSGATGNG